MVSLLFQLHRELVDYVFHLTEALLPFRLIRIQTLFQTKIFERSVFVPYSSIFCLFFLLYEGTEFRINSLNLHDELLVSFFEQIDIFFSFPQLSLFFRVLNLQIRNPAPKRIKNTLSIFVLGGNLLLIGCELSPVAR